MKTNGLKIDTPESAESEGKCKKEWVKPEVEIISTDLIKGGPISFTTEGQQTSVIGLRGAS